MKRPFIPTVGSNDPTQIRDLKRWCEQMVRYCDAQGAEADGYTTEKHGRVISAVLPKYGFKVYRTGGADRWNVSGGAFTSQLGVRRFPSNTASYDGDDPRARHTIGSLPAVGADTAFNVYAHIDQDATGAGSVIFSTNSTESGYEYSVKIAEIEDNVVRQQMVGDQIITDDDDLGEYWYSRNIGIHPKPFANSDTGAADDLIPALYLSAGGMYADAGVWSDMGTCDAAGIFTDDDGSDNIRAELVDLGYAGQFWKGWVNDSTYDIRVVLCDKDENVALEAKLTDNWLVKLAGTEAGYFSDEEKPAPNGFVAKLVTNDEVAWFDDGVYEVIACNDDQALWAYDASSFDAKLVTATAAARFEDILNSHVALFGGGTYCADITGAINSDGYWASGDEGVDYVSGAGTLSFRHGILINGTQFEADIITVIDNWLQGGGWHDDHGLLSGLLDDDHPQYWLVGSDYTRNTAASGVFTDHLRVDQIYDEARTAGNPYVDVLNAVLYGISSVKSVDWGSRQLVNSAGTIVLDWSGDSVDMRGGVQVNTTQLTANTTLDETNNLVDIKASAGAVTATLPAAPTDGQVYHFTVSDGTNTATIARNGKTIFGEALDVEIYEGEQLDLRYSSVDGDWR